MKSYSKLGHGINQQIWSMAHMNFAVSCVATNVVIDDRKKNLTIDGSEVEQFILNGIHSTKKFVYNNLNDSSVFNNVNSEDRLRIDPPDY